MFVAKFSQTSGAPFSQDKNGNFPFIGTILAGKSKGSLINGTIFQREGLEANTLYACENTTRQYEGTEQVETVILGKVSMLEYVQLITQLGEGKLDVATSDVTVAETVSLEEGM
jgi:hypothetical protein